MCCSSRLSRTKERGSGSGLATAVAIALALIFGGAAISSPALAQSPTPGPSPVPAASPSPTPVPTPTQINSDVSSASTVTNLGSSFLERLGDQASSGFGRALRTNPGGGGASETTDAPTIRTWAEAYGITVRDSAQGNFVADQRQTWGGVGGIGARLAPGVNVGLSVDQSRTTIDVPLALQSATLDLTQVGFNGSIDKGAWTWAIALVHGFGNVNSSRDTGFGTASAGYTAEIDGALTELSYYWSVEQSRIVPKAALEYVRATTSAFREMGGFDPLSVTGTTVERSRVLLGAEVGHYWIINQKVLDLSAYGKFVDNFSQNFGSVVVSLGPQSITVQGIGESQYGADAGASASLNLTNMVRLYINYDGKFRAAMQSHQGTAGVEVKW